MSTESLPAPFDVRAIAQDERAALQFTETLPLALVSLLERRYLSPFQPGHWNLHPRDGDSARPLLREVVSLGRPKRPEEWALAMPHVLTACHDPGHSLVMTLYGQGDRHRLFLGGRRIIGAGARSTEDYLLGQESAFKSYLSGLRVGPVRRLDTEEHPDLASFLQSAPALGVVTGIPSRREDAGPLQFQSLDRLVNAVGNQRYVLMVAAEPLDPWLIDQTLDACRHLQSEIHAYTRRTINRSQGGSTGSSRREELEKDWKTDLPFYLYGLAMFANLAGAFAGLPLGAASTLLSRLGPLAASAQTSGMMANMAVMRDNASQLSEGKNWSESGGIELVNANAAACEALLQKHVERLQSARSSGWWRTAVYIAAESEAALSSVQGALRSLCGGQTTALDPIRTVSLPDTSLLRGAIERGQVLTMLPAAGEQGHPLGAPFDALGTCINSEELSVLVNMPQQEIPGLPMRDQSEFALSIPAQSDSGIPLGYLQDSQGRDLGAVTVTQKSMNRHVFVSGITGSGKTNTCMQLLLESYERFGVPFLVLEPAKTEYRRLIQVPELAGKLRVYSVGGQSGYPFRLNPLSPVDGTPLGRHIDLLKAVFNASFPMFAGMAYVLEEAILDIYAERGWSLYTSENRYLDDRPTQDELSALTPSLQDLHDQVDVVLNRKKYGQEIHQNMGAALRSRLKSMLVGNKGTMLNTRRSTPMRDLFELPTVIELQNLGDDEEKAFVMALLFVLLYEYAERRQRDIPDERRGGLQHITLVEEAHRLLKATRGPASADVGDPSSKAVSMFTDMLAEMRAYGEGFIIADQIPTKLAPETMKNSNLKIIHRLVAPDDRMAAGSCVNLTEWQMRHLNNLSIGQAIVHDEQIGEAVLTRINPVKDTRAPERTASELQGRIVSPDSLRPSYLLRHAGCRSCPRPCTFYHRLEEADDQPEMAAALQPFLESLLLDQPVPAWEAWAGWRETWRQEAQAMFGARGETVTGVTYCAATNAAYDWLGELLKARSAQSGKEPEMTPQNRLAREQAARALGEMLILWTGKAELDAEAEAAFYKAREQARAAVMPAPPKERPGCAECPARCEMLPWVAPHLQKLGKALQPSLLGTVPLPTRMENARRAALPLQQAIPTLMRRAKRPEVGRNWLYCAVVNAELPPSAHPARTEVLGAIRSTTAAPAAVLSLLGEPAVSAPEASDSEVGAMTAE